MLRFIAEDEKLKLGINWYLADTLKLREEHRNDGRYISYLLDEKDNHDFYRKCDTNLYDFLNKLVRPKRIDKKNVKSEGNRCLRDIKKILPNVIFYDAEVNSDRKKWLEESFKELKACDVVFLDPDNGLKPESYTENNKKSVKYVFANEIEEYFNKGKSLIIYQHFNRKKEGEFYKNLESIEKKIKPRHGSETFSIRFHRYNVREYLFILQAVHKGIKRRIESEFLKSEWGIPRKSKKPHFTSGRIILT